jgi:hypothetical protein
MLKTTSVLVLAVLALSACAQETSNGPGSNGNGYSSGSGGGTSASTMPEVSTMPEMTFSVTERDGASGVVMEATVEFASDGSWERTGTESGSGKLTDEEVARIDELVRAPDFPTDPDNDLGCTTEEPPYLWSLTVGDDRVSNGNGGCVFSGSAVEIYKIISGAADVGPTLE